MHLIKKNIIIPLVVFIIGMSAVAGIVCSINNEQNKQNRTMANLNAMTYAERMKTDIMKGIGVSDILRQIIISDDGQLNKFYEIAEEMMTDSVQSIQIAPGGVVTDIYPQEGNDAGKIDLLNDKDRGEICRYGRDNKVVTMQGYSLLTGSLTLTLMVLPLVTRNTQEALKTVPDSFRTGAVGLGAGKWYTIRTILLPSAMPGIVTGVILAIGRIIGESAALLFTAGSAHLLPKTFNAFLEKIFHSGGTLTIQLYLSASKGEFEVAFGIAVVLLVIVLLINFGTKRLAKKLEKH